MLLVMTGLFHTTRVQYIRNAEINVESDIVLPIYEAFKVITKCLLVQHVFSNTSITTCM